jgi:hypothetical protein
MLKHLKTTLSIILFVLVMQTMHATEAKGYYITLNNDTVYVKFKIPLGFFDGDIRHNALQSKITYFDSLGKKQIIRPNGAKGYYFEYLGEKFLFVSLKNTIGLWSSLDNTTDYIFLSIKIEGPLRLYSYYYTQSTPGRYNGSSFSGGSSSVEEGYVLQKSGKDIFKPSSLFFKRDMMAYFSDFPELAQKIEKKELKNNNMEEIVKEYNQWVLKNK